MKFLKWKDDSFFSKQGSFLEYDKLEHYILGILLTAILFGFAGVGPVALGLFSVVAIGWEVKDGLVPYDGEHIQGFSWKDLFADYMGYFTALYALKFHNFFDTIWSSF